MNRKDYTNFLQKNFLPQDLFDSLLQTKESYVTRKNIFVNADETIEYVDEGSEGWVRNRATDLDALSPIFNEYFIQLFKTTKQRLIQEGAVNPRLHGVRFYRNNESMPWHKDYNVEEIPELKRLLTVYMINPVLPQEQYDKFIVSVYPNSPGHWGLGFKTDLEPNLILGHNQLFGHEFINSGAPYNVNRDVLTMLWWDE